jgi:DNA-binding transcriptional ArsR family regulator
MVVSTRCPAALGLTPPRLERAVMREADRQQVFRFLDGFVLTVNRAMDSLEAGPLDALRSQIARDTLRWLDSAPVPANVEPLAAAIRTALELVVRSAGHTADSLEDELLAIGKDLTTVALEHGIVPVTLEVCRRLLTRDSWALLDLSDPAWRDILETALEQHGHPDPKGVIERLDRMTGS